MDSRAVFADIEYIRLSAGYILGPFMGIGLIVPGLMGERRVARLRAADGGG